MERFIVFVLIAYRLDLAIFKIQYGEIYSNYHTALADALA